MRNGNNIDEVGTSNGRLVLTVPMRNGNKSKGLAEYLGELGSYRTYEEWKLASVFPCVAIASSVLTVPMRNGNPVRFRAYLTNNSVLTVPMRNGNTIL